MFNIVLVHPQIPNNTGNIGRLCVATNCKLHLVKPLGFELTDKYLKRAGLDYWKHVDLVVHNSWEDFLNQLPKGSNIYFTSAKANKNYWQTTYKPNDYIVFGREADGLPSTIFDNENAIKIPIYSDNVRSLNLANAVALVVYEGLRQLQS